MATAYVLVNIDGQALYDFSPGAVLEQVDVTQEINQHWTCFVQCRQTEDQRFPIEDSLGKDLQVIAVADDGTQTYLFNGFLLDVELEYEIFGSYVARLSGVTKTYHMDVAPRQNYYDYGTNTLENIAKKTTEVAGLTANIATTRFPAAYEYPVPAVQWGETDYRFLIRLADHLLVWLVPNAQDGTTVDLLDNFGSGPTLGWRAEDQLLSFRLRGKLASAANDGAHYNPLKALSQVFTDVKGEYEFLSGAADMVAKVKDQSLAVHKNGYITDRREMTELEYYKVLLAKEVNRAIQSSAIGQGVSLDPTVAAGKKVTIQGLTNAEGDYGVTKVLHQWTPNGYTNQFWCMASSEYRDPTPPPKKQWYGVVIGRVVDNNDPQKLGRIQLQYFWQEQNQTSWARMMMPHTGSQRGIYFMPEVGDEVVVAFEDGDPERPIVLGCLWNATDTPPTEDYWGGEYANNDVKRIMTKSGHRIQLVDKQGKESISIATPTHLKIAMVESSDENGRPTMTLHSDGDIILSATGRIHLKSAFFSREVG
ncbi:MAG TPA: phage baseplate assembly protein V [Bryobacteraceae bacterium]|nr:phage baseplate assembly protein V [Bryobacteraceae bacterium]